MTLLRDSIETKDREERGGDVRCKKDAVVGGGCDSHTKTNSRIKLFNVFSANQFHSNISQNGLKQVCKHLLSFF